MTVAGDAARAAAALAGEAGDAAREVYGKVAPVAAPAVEAAARELAPLYEKISAEASQAVASAAGEVTPLAGRLGAESARAVGDSVRGLAASTGVDVDAVASATAPLLRQGGAAAEAGAAGFLALARADPAQAAALAAAAAAGVLLLPALGGLLAGLARGYRADLSPLEAFDLLAKTPGAVMVDVRSAAERLSGGRPETPRGAPAEVDFAVTEDRQLRGQLRDARGVEEAVTALQIAGLRRVGRGRPVVLLDSGSGSGVAAAVARRLARLGFGGVYVVRGGIRAWTAAKLAVKREQPASAALDRRAAAAAAQRGTQVVRAGGKAAAGGKAGGRR